MSTSSCQAINMDMLGQGMVKDAIEARFGDVVHVHEKTVLEEVLIAKYQDVYNRDGFISPARGVLVQALQFCDCSHQFRGECGN